MTMTLTQNFAIVQRIESIRPHPDPTRTKIEVIKLGLGDELVTGKHYRAGLLGIYLSAGCWIPGWLAEDLWLVGKKRSNEPFEVRSINIFGVESPGLFCGAEYMTDGSEASAERYKKLEKEGGERKRLEGAAMFDWITWPRWRSHWQEGMVLDGYLGVRPAIVGAANWTGLVRTQDGIPYSAPAGYDPTIGASVAMPLGSFSPLDGSRAIPRQDPTLAAPILTDPLIFDSVPPSPTTYCSVCGGVTHNPPSQIHSVWCSCPSPTTGL